MTATKPAADWERIGMPARPLAAVYADLDATLSRLGIVYGVRKIEADLVREFLEVREMYSSKLPFNQADRVVTEMAFKFGRADIVIFHVDGTASVIEAKDGSKGYNHVVSGIGQAGLYAAQLAMGGALKAVRRCLLWSSTGNHRLDAGISVVCDQAGVDWLLFPSLALTAGLDALTAEGLLT